MKVSLRSFNVLLLLHLQHVLGLLIHFRNQVAAIQRECDMQIAAECSAD